MRILAAIFAAFLALAPAASARQSGEASAFTYPKLMVPMRDGARLETVIMRPNDKAGPLPILLQRTP